MEVYINDGGELTCAMPLPQSTVAELAEAVGRFCLKAVDCSVCTHTCCAGFIVYGDNVFIRSLAAMIGQTMGKVDAGAVVLKAIALDFKTMNWFVRQTNGGTCQFLSPAGRCLIYNIRPLVCRMHVCRPSEPRYKLMKDYLYFAYQAALQYEMSRLLSAANLPQPHHWIKDNPLINMETYDAAIPEIIAWSQAHWHLRPESSPQPPHQPGGLHSI
ncbi:YkgJ family cysteine cluster protein [Acetonema longum]|uniref:YkgJ family cysteine cluster protein n=1 Tax=Acetonema longum DSM 6540 TaxID=1009370 RepID=F7NJ42_9FIRM|nr:zinc/iron-chelating domain-containing protein [Acetonema longum]EGO63932.1 hypothetical protein ALO_10489 [Acetonema longum DSM 6540]